MIRRPPRSTLDRSSAASDVYKRQGPATVKHPKAIFHVTYAGILSLIHISEPTRQAEISYAVFCLKKKKRKKLRGAPACAAAISAAPEGNGPRVVSPRAP